MQVIYHFNFQLLTVILDLTHTQTSVFSCTVVSLCCWAQIHGLLANRFNVVAIVCTSWPSLCKLSFLEFLFSAYLVTSDYHQYNTSEIFEPEDEEIADEFLFLCFSADNILHVLRRLQVFLLITVLSHPIGYLLGTRFVLISPQSCHIKGKSSKLQRFQQLY